MTPNDIEVEDWELLRAPHQIFVEPNSLVTAGYFNHTRIERDAESSPCDAAEDIHGKAAGCGPNSAPTTLFKFQTLRNVL